MTLHQAVARIICAFLRAHSGEVPAAELPALIQLVAAALVPSPPPVIRKRVRHRFF